MAMINELDQKAWGEWVATRPEVVQKLCNDYPPDRLYKIKETGKRITLHSYSEDGTMTVNMTGEYNAVIFNSRVFGIKPEDIEECDLPATDEPTGTMLTKEGDVNEFIDATRANRDDA